MLKTLQKTSLCLCTCIALSACASGNDITMPFFGLTKERQFINAQTVLPQDGDIKPMAHWWKRIDDPVLEGYVEQLLSSNLGLLQASERVIQAQERLNIQRGSYFPQISGDIAANRSFTPGTTKRIFTDNYRAELDTAWEIDLFGRIRKSVSSARSSFNASVYDQEALKHALIAELTKRRIGISVQKRLLDLAQQNAQNRESFYNLVKRRYDLGAQGVSSSDVFLAEENFTSVQADIFQFERQLSEESYALDVLLGQMPGTTDPFASKFPMIVPPLDIPICLPADLIDRRPDLKASNFRMQAAKADIGVAVADLYPSISLGGSLGFTGTSGSDFFSAEQLAGSLLGNIMTRIFEGGRLRANIRLQESEAKELAAAYAENILNAVREVETALKAETELKKELKATGKSVQALKNAVTISDDRYSRGIETLQNLLDTQQRTYLREQEYILTQQSRWNARIDLYLALGGDWFEQDMAADHTCTKEQKDE